jgi:glycosyltransferase involved in cell wall biosynthesis
MISVCMATYNGSKWIRLQLESILSQINAGDEVILVDDASSDDTVAIIESYADPRIKIYRNKTNLGVNGAFERAFGLAQGNVIFFSDQDDLWKPHKVRTIMDIFDKRSEVTLVLSEADIIDATGTPAGATYFGDRGRFVPGLIANIVKSKFLGCAMAVRREIVQKSLPFPATIPGHDMWIGVINEFHGKTAFVQEPLIAYRRHDSNASPFRHSGMANMIIWRWQLFAPLLKHMLKHGLVSGRR